MLNPVGIHVPSFTSTVHFAPQYAALRIMSSYSCWRDPLECSSRCKTRLVFFCQFMCCSFCSCLYIFCTFLYIILYVNRFCLVLRFFTLFFYFLFVVVSTMLKLLISVVYCCIMRSPPPTSSCWNVFQIMLMTEAVQYFFGHFVFFQQQQSSCVDWTFFCHIFVEVLFQLL